MEIFNVKHIKSIRHFEFSIMYNLIEYKFWAEVSIGPTFTYLSRWGKLGGEDYSSYTNLQLADKYEINKLVHEYFK